MLEAMGSVTMLNQFFQTENIDVALIKVHYKKTVILSFKKQQHKFTETPYNPPFHMKLTTQWDTDTTNFILYVCL